MVAHVCTARCGLRSALIVGLSALAFSLAGCGGDNPVPPPPPPPQDSTIPDVPDFTNPNADPVPRSESLSLIRRAPDYAPPITTAKCTWQIKGQGRYESSSGGWVDCRGDWRTLYAGSNTWSHQLPAFSGQFDGCGLLSNYSASNWKLAFTTFPADQRFRLVRNGEIVSGPAPVTWTAGEVEICRERIPVVNTCTSKVHITVQYKATGKPLTSPPYLRRVRYWAPQVWEGGSFVARTTGNEVLKKTTSYTTGYSEALTYALAVTLGAEIGASGDVCSAKVSTSITQTFSTTFTVSRETTKSDEKDLQGVAGKRTCFIYWALVEEYSFTNADGTPFTDSSYEFTTIAPFKVIGVHSEIGKYIFDLNSNALVGMEFIPVR